MEAQLPGPPAQQPPRTTRLEPIEDPLGFRRKKVSVRGNVGKFGVDFDKIDTGKWTGKRLFHHSIIPVVSAAN